MPAVLADARAGEWNFRVAVIAFNGDIYRMIFAVKSMTPETSRKFDQSIASFHPITPQEQKLAQPLHLRLAVAGAGDNAATMAAKMALTDRPLEQFELLNGLDSDQLNAGRELQDRGFLNFVKKTGASTSPTMASRPWRSTSGAGRRPTTRSTIWYRTAEPAPDRIRAARTAVARAIICWAMS